MHQHGLPLPHESRFPKASQWAHYNSTLGAQTIHTRTIKAGRHATSVAISRVFSLLLTWSLASQSILLTNALHQTSTGVPEPSITVGYNAPKGSGADFTHFAKVMCRTVFRKISRRAVIGAIS
jgi:hypothetical protein